MHDKMMADSVKGIPLTQVNKVVHAIIQAPRPKFRYKIGKMAKQLTFLNSLLPEQMFQNAVLKSFKVPKKINY
jgi:hypothetical protein